MNGKHFQRLRFKVSSAYRQQFITITQDMTTIVSGHGYILEIAAVDFSQFFTHWPRHIVAGSYLAIHCIILHYLGDGVVIFEILVERQFVPYTKADQHSYGNTNRKAADIDQR